MIPVFVCLACLITFFAGLIIIGRKWVDNQDEKKARAMDKFWEGRRRQKEEIDEYAETVFQQCMKIESE